MSLASRSSTPRETHPVFGRSPLWPLLGLLTLAWAAELVFMPGVEGMRLAIRTTARTSLCFFLAAYTAAALAALLPGQRWAVWLRTHRRQWGRLFVASHVLHGIAILMLAQAAPALFDQLSPMSNRITGGLAYVILLAMGLSSFDRTAAWLGPKAWARLHTWGSHYLWLSFLVANGKRVPAQAAYALPVVLLLAALALRWWAARRIKAAPASVSPGVPTGPRPAAANRR